MRFILNLIWCLVIGIPHFILFGVVGIACCATLVLIPFGIQFFKLMRLALLPFRYNVDVNHDEYIGVNVFWDLVIGIVLTVEFLLLGVIFCLSIIGIPFGLKCFKLMRLAFTPFGAELDEV